VTRRRFISPENAAAHAKIQGSTFRFAPAALLVLCLAVSCRGEETVERVTLPATPVISVRPRWAVATAEYTRVYAEADPRSPIQGHLRLGDVASVATIITRQDDDGASRWFQIATDEVAGWVPEGTLDFFESSDRARNMSALIRRSREQ